MSYLYKGQDIRPITFKHQGKVNKYKDVTVMRIISLEQPSFISSGVKPRNFSFWDVRRPTIVAAEAASARKSVLICIGD